MTAYTAFNPWAFYALGFQMDPSSRRRGGGRTYRSKKEIAEFLARQRELDREAELSREIEQAERDQRAKIRETLEEASAALQALKGIWIAPNIENADRIAAELRSIPAVVEVKETPEIALDALVAEVKSARAATPKSVNELLGIRDLPTRRVEKPIDPAQLIEAAEALEALEIFIEAMENT